MLRATTFPGGITATVADVPGGGGGPRLLLIHGMFGGAWQFEEWQERLARMGHSSVAIGLRAHRGGRGGADGANASLRDYVDDALVVAREMGRPTVIGHSMGGLIAQKLAEEDTVSAAVLICSAPPRWISALSGRLLSHMLKYTPELLLARPIVAARADADALFLNHVPLAERDRIFQRLVPESGRVARELALGALAVDARRVSCPILSMGAGGDRFLPPRIARAIAKKYGCEHREYAAHGHYIVGEPGWEQVADDAMGWLAARRRSFTPRTSPPTRPR